MFVSIMLTWSVALGLLFWCGWGLTRLVLPSTLHPYSVLLMPLIGYCIVIWTGYQAVHLNWSLRELTPWLLIGCGILNSLAWWRKRPHLNREKIRHLGYPLPWIILATLMIGVLPAFSYANLTLIGGGWDAESYLALAAHLQDYTLAEIPQAASSPLRDHVINPPIIGLSMGMSIVQGVVGILSGQTMLAVFVPYMALLRALGFIAVYVWLRSSMGLTRQAASWGVAFGSAGALLLWVTYFNFGMQLGGWPLITLVLALSVGALEDLQARGWSSWPGLILAAFAWAIVPMTYYPALTVAVPMALGLAGAMVLQARTHVVRSALGIAVILSLIVPLSTWVISDYFAGFAFRYANSLTTLGLFHFIPLSDVFGLSAFHQQESSAPTMLTIGALIGMGALLIVGLARGPQRLRWTLTMLGALVYVLWVRFGREYHYAYIKGAAYVHFALMGLLAAGWQAAWQSNKQLLRYGVSGAMAVLLIFSITAQTTVIRNHWGRPQLNLTAPAALDQVADELTPVDAPIYLRPPVERNGPAMSMIAAALYPHPLWGYVFTGYDHLNQPPQGTPSYLLLESTTTPSAQGLPPAEQIWSSEDLSLWRVDTTNISNWIPGRRLVTGPEFAHQTPAGMSALDWVGPLRIIDNTQPLSLTAQNTTFVADVAVLTPTLVTISGEDKQLELELEPGFQRIEQPFNGSITLASNEPLALMQAYTAKTPSTTSNQVANWLIVQPQLTLNPNSLNLAMNMTNQSGRALRGELTISENRWSAATASTSVIGLPMNGTFDIEIDPINGTINSNGATLLSQTMTKLNPGEYWLQWTMLDGAQRVHSWPLGVFNVENNTLAAVQLYPYTIEAIQLAELPTTGQLNQLQVGEAYQLLNATWPTQTSEDSIELELVWQLAEQAQPAMISAQLLDANASKIAQWDGLIGGWYTESSGQGAAFVRQTIPLQLDAATPAGEYRLLLTAYDPNTATPLLIDGQASIIAGTLQIR